MNPCFSNKFPLTTLSVQVCKSLDQKIIFWKFSYYPKKQKHESRKSLIPYFIYTYIYIYSANFFRTEDYGMRSSQPLLTFGGCGRILSDENRRASQWVLDDSSDALSRQKSQERLLNPGKLKQIGLYSIDNIIPDNKEGKFNPIQNKIIFKLWVIPFIFSLGRNNSHLNQIIIVNIIFSLLEAKCVMKLIKLHSLHFYHFRLSQCSS